VPILVLVSLLAGFLSKQSNFRTKFLNSYVVLWRYMVFRISMRFTRLFLTISGGNGPDRFDLTNVERGPRSNFWDHSQHFQTNGFGVIDPNRPILKEILLILYIWGKSFFFANAAIWILQEILIFSLQNLKEKIISLKNIIQ